MDEMSLDIWGYGAAVTPLLGGWILDRILGDPAWLPHPVVCFGKFIAYFEQKINKGSYRKLKGALVSVMLVAAVFFLVLALIRLLAPYPGARIIVETVGVFYCLAGKTLSKEVKMVFEACNIGIEKARKQIARIVGRDTGNLDFQEIRTAALETLAENMSDGVIAPLFWYLLLGLPGMFAYKMINTLDSMVGYKNERYRDYGYFSAKMDDVANFIPARLTAFLMIILSGQIRLFRFVRRYGRSHASPNSGYPESALAGILDCRFGGAHDYFGETVYKPYIGNHEKELTDSDLKISLRVCMLAEVGMILISMACIFFVHTI